MKTDYRSIWIIGGLFFIFGFVTWLNSVLIPYLKIACELTNFEAYFVTFSFYLSYFVMAIPSGKLLKITGFKKGMSLGLLIMAAGALIFIPAALTRTFYVFLFGLFIQGTGLALLQTASNPYITILGPIESAAKRISMMGICNKVAGALAPVVLGAVTLRNSEQLLNLQKMDFDDKQLLLDELAQRVIVPYIIIALVLCGLSCFIYLSKLPEINIGESEEGTSVAASQKSIFQFSNLWLGAIAMFLYVGLEVIAGDTIIIYGNVQGLTLASAKFLTTITLCCMIIGYVTGVLCIPKYINQNKALKISACLGLVFTTGAVFSDGYLSVFFIALLGLANALIFPGIWPKAIDGLGSHTKIGSSILIMGFVGGAILPMIYGGLADVINYKEAYYMLFPCYAFLLYFGFYRRNTGH